MAEPETSALGAFGRSVADGLTGGFSTQIEAYARSRIFGGNYETLREEIHTRATLQRTEHPTVSKVGIGVGVGALMLGGSFTPAGAGVTVARVISATGGVSLLSNMFFNSRP